MMGVKRLRMRSSSSALMITSALIPLMSPIVIPNFSLLIVSFYVCVRGDRTNMFTSIFD